VSGTERLNFEAEVCPKRVWVLSVLSDDEALDDPRELPRGLSFHLSRCDSCRAIADRLLCVTESLSALGSLAAPDELADRANRQAQAALRAGGQPTGRVHLAESIDLAPGNAMARGGWRLGGLRFAAAAVVVLAAATFGLSTFRGAMRLHGATQRSVVERAPILRNSPTPVPSIGLDTEDVRLSAAANGLAARDLATTDEATVLPLHLPDWIDDPFGDPPTDLPGGSFSTFAYRRPFEAPRQPRTHRYCRHRSPIDAALCDDPHCIPTAVVLPGGARLMMQSRPDPFDN